MAATVCVIVPFFNPGIDALAECVASIQLQSYADWELILLDDGSTDGSLTWANSIRDSRIKVVSDGKNLGLIARLNQMTSLSTAPFIARMDADDAAMPNRLALQMEALQGGHDLCATAVVSCDSSMRPVAWRRSSHLSSSDEREWLMGRKGIVHASIIARREWFARNPYEPSAHRIEDLVLFAGARYNKDFKLVSIDQPLYLYREEGNVVPAKLKAAYLSQLKWGLTWNVPFRPRVEIIARAAFKWAVVKFLWNFGLKGKLIRRRGQAIGPHRESILTALEDIQKKAEELKSAPTLDNG